VLYFTPLLIYFLFKQKVGVGHKSFSLHHCRKDTSQKLLVVRVGMGFVTDFLFRFGFDLQDSF